MAFLETPRFPETISFGSRGGPGWSTTVITLNSGYEQRNQNWSHTRHSYDASFGVRGQADLDTLINFFQAAKGRLNAFRYKDHLDFKTVAPESSVAFDDQIIGVGTGAPEAFQLVKNYTIGALTYARVLSKIVSGTLVAGFDGVQKTEGVDFTVDYNTGIITFSATIPNGVDVTWGGEFDTPVRFDSDSLDITLAAYKLGSANVPLVEIRI